MAEYRVTLLKDAGLLLPMVRPMQHLLKLCHYPLQAIAKAHGLKIINTLTGFKWIGEKLRIYEEKLCETYLRETGVVLITMQLLLKNAPNCS